MPQHSRQNQSINQKLFVTRAASCTELDYCLGPVCKYYSFNDKTQLSVLFNYLIHFSHSVLIHLCSKHFLQHHISSVYSVLVTFLFFIFQLSRRLFTCRSVQQHFDPYFDVYVALWRWPNHSEKASKFLLRAGLYDTAVKTWDIKAYADKSWPNVSMPAGNFLQRLHCLRNKVLLKLLLAEFSVHPVWSYLHHHHQQCLEWASKHQYCHRVSCREFPAPTCLWLVFLTRHSPCFLSSLCHPTHTNTGISTGVSTGIIRWYDSTCSRKLTNIIVILNSRPRLWHSRRKGQRLTFTVGYSKIKQGIQLSVFQCFP